MSKFAFLRKTSSLIIIFFITLVILFGGIISYKKFGTKPLQKINYAYQPWPGTLPYLVAYEKGFFREQGLDVTLIKAESYVQEISDFISGRVDFIGDFALIDVLRQVSLGEKIKVILATDYSNGADGIVARKEIKNVSDLRGRKIAVEKETLGEYLLYDALNKNGLSLNDIQEINLSAQEAAQAFIRGEVDAAVTYEPDFSMAVNNGDGWRLYSSVKSPGLIIDTLVFKDDFIKQNPETVFAVLKAYNQALDFINNNPKEAYLIGAKHCGVSATEFEEQYLGIKQLSLQENISLMTYRTGNDSLHGLIDQTYKFLVEKGNVKERIDSIEVVDPKFIRNLNK